MTGYFWNRINGKFINNFPDNYFVGQYQVVPKYLTFINNIPSTGFDFIVPDNTNESRVIIHKQSVDKKLKYNKKLLPFPKFININKKKEPKSNDNLIEIH